MKVRLGCLILLFSLVLFPVSAFASTWAKTYGGSGWEDARSIQQTSDGGFIVAGINGNGFWVLKLNSTGNVTWQKAYGNSVNDVVSSIQQTSDGGFIVAGFTGSHMYNLDFWVLKLNNTGNVIWQKTYGGSDLDAAWSIQQTSDGGYIVAGDTSPLHILGSISPISADYYIWVLKLDANGNVTWQKAYSGSGVEDARSIQQTSDGGFIVAGMNDNGFWVLKLNSTGNVTWQKAYGGSSTDHGRSIQQTSDGGFIVAGRTASYGAGDYDIWVLKLNSTGNVTWQKTYGGSNWDDTDSIQQTSDGGFIVAGSTNSYGGYADCWVLKLNNTGNVIWQKTYGGSDHDAASSIQQTSDGGFIVAGYTGSYGAGDYDIWVLKLNSNGNIPGCDLINDTSVVPTNTSAIPNTTSAIPYNTATTGNNTSVVPVNTAASVKEQCFYAESSTDLVFSPVTPCRIVDTRKAGGAIPPGGIRGYRVRGNNAQMTSQGGNPSGCPSPGNLEPYGVHINVTAVPVAGPGNIVAYPFGSGTPKASLVNYKFGVQNIANSGTVLTCWDCGNDINIKSNNGTTHVVIDVLGYDFKKP
jgi:uncharacterized delta-60 repeat protein